MFAWFAKCDRRDADRAGSYFTHFAEGFVFCCNCSWEKDEAVGCKMAMWGLQ